MPDHVHILVGVTPDIAVSDLVRDIKANPSKFINRQRWVVGVLITFHVLRRTCRPAGAKGVLFPVNPSIQKILIQAIFLRDPTTPPSPLPRFPACSLFLITFYVLRRTCRPAGAERFDRLVFNPRNPLIRVNP